MAKVAIIFYSTFGHIEKLSKVVQEGVLSAGGKADIYRVEETLSEDALLKLGAPATSTEIPVAGKDVLEDYDAFLFGVPTRFGNVPAEWSTFWDQTGSLWVNGTLNGKPAGLFVSTASYGGGQESTISNCLNYLVHHGMIYIPLGYKNVFPELSNIEEINGGTAWGSGTLVGSDGFRAASKQELKVAKIQGQTFYNTIKCLYASETP
ncbi:uncharacterized protein KNAG_0H01770 [Huiozyma naganishii CBS 8797]|uniref:Flavodoxin-like domain-containing protein n=1 Tax=Huiozyma naganishii (strain ATCC MYA-139 / BCRC 22969 / CBS 8797 / KCTC 17520 / NBRC 10181 / NCYC 3082 / Yp74L-3) TaxID=1071383 RepID=J7S1R6_HUIN7|nr:hypothetical protein KNAG_0H01770 [Kazachstania naganishii CBS 8797]CCK71592.1 hypothetical protein KNAG_0H01770 [Kazachstania naganishii CBS 8797]